MRSRIFEITMSRQLVTCCQRLGEIKNPRTGRPVVQLLLKLCRAMGKLMPIVLLCKDGRDPASINHGDLANKCRGISVFDDCKVLNWDSLDKAKPL